MKTYRTLEGKISVVHIRRGYYIFKDKTYQMRITYFELPFCFMKVLTLATSFILNVWGCFDKNYFSLWGIFQLKK